MIHVEKFYLGEASQGRDKVDFTFFSSKDYSINYTIEFYIKDFIQGYFINTSGCNEYIVKDIKGYIFTLSVYEEDNKIMYSVEYGDLFGKIKSLFFNISENSFKDILNTKNDLSLFIMTQF